MQHKSCLQAFGKDKLRKQFTRRARTVQILREQNKRASPIVRLIKKEKYAKFYLKNTQLPIIRTHL